MNESGLPQLDIVCRGLVSYTEGEALQRRCWEERRDGELGDTLILLEHPPVVTLGVQKRSAADVLFSRDELERRGIELIHTDRGGLATLHAPGQLTGYFFIRLAGVRGGLRGLIDGIQRLLIETCGALGVEAAADDDEPGIWVGGEPPAARRKIASLGLAIRRGVTRHGFALNVCNDLGLFSVLRPCGHASTVMTSLARELGREVPVEEAIRALRGCHVFGDLSTDTV